MTNYKEINNMIKYYFEGINDNITILANISAILNQYMDDINWVGFYIIKNDKLILGPFQGKPACMEIKIGRGVCGMAAHENRSILVPNVHEFEGHIACDSCSNSELVIPIRVNNSLFGVLDIDSPTIGRFKEEDLLELEKVVRLIEKLLNYKVG